MESSACLARRGRAPVFAKPEGVVGRGTRLNQQMKDSCRSVDSRMERLRRSANGCKRTVLAASRGGDPAGLAGSVAIAVERREDLQTGTKR